MSHLAEDGCLPESCLEVSEDGGDVLHLAGCELLHHPQLAVPPPPDLPITLHHNQDYEEICNNCFCLTWYLIKFAAFNCFNQTGRLSSSVRLVRLDLKFIAWQLCKLIYLGCKILIWKLQNYPSQFWLEFVSETERRSSGRLRARRSTRSIASTKETDFPQTNLWRGEEK